MKFTNPIPIWRSTAMRQITDTYTDRRGGRCAIGVLTIPKYAHEMLCPEAPFAYGIDGPQIVDLNDEKGMTFQEIADEVERNPEKYLVPEAIAQFQEEAAIAQEFESLPVTEAVAVKGGVA